MVRGRDLLLGVLRLPHRGKGQALTLAERAAAPGPILLCDADLRGDLRPLTGMDADLTVAAFARRQGGGFGIAASDFLFPSAHEVATREALAPARAGVRIVKAELGSDAGVIGAGLLAFEAIDQEG